MPRQSRAAGQAAVQRVRALIAAVQGTLPPTEKPGSAAFIASQLVGALQLARALGDNAEGKAVLAGKRRTLLGRYDTTASRLSFKAFQRATRRCSTLERKYDDHHIRAVTLPHPTTKETHHWRECGQGFAK
jgi:hypothetical protein